MNNKTNEQKSHLAEGWRFAQAKQELEILELKFGIFVMEQMLEELKRYNPSQPRVPAGNRFGGRWTGGGETGGASRPRVVGKKPKEPALYPKVAVSDRIGDDANAVQVAESGEIVSDGVVSDDFVGNQKPAKPERIPRSKRSNPVSGEKLEVSDETGQVPNKVNIFIGGAGDSSHGIVGKSNSLHYDVYGQNYYYNHDEGDAAEELINSLPEGTEINVIGHSWGGSTAANIVEDNPGKINKLITIDPVTKRIGRADFDKLKENTEQWINIDAIGRPGRTTGGDSVAIRKWGIEPDEYADVFVQAPFAHEDFDAMINYKPVYNDINYLLDDTKPKLSPREMLNEELFH
jgi:pimeloyl-ACP methyl ester carboxylesterase